MMMMMMMMMMMIIIIIRIIIIIIIKGTARGTGTIKYTKYSIQVAQHNVGLHSKLRISVQLLLHWVVN